MQVRYYTFYYSGLFTILGIACKLLKRLKAAVGIEPTNKGFAVQSEDILLSNMERHRRIESSFFL
jgi:hypothetical protein